jgi:hypothetical protein
VAVIELRLPDRVELPGVVNIAAARYLDSELRELARREILAFSVRDPDDSQPAEPPFLRGDVDGDGLVTTSDSVKLLQHLFFGTFTPSCAKAGDANDDGTLSSLDAVSILRHLFAGEPRPAPSAACGADPTADSLGCGRFDACP